MKVIQTKQAKAKFYSPLFDYLKVSRSRKEIANFMCTCDRVARDEINGISKHYAVIRGSHFMGYRLARPIHLLNDEELEQEICLVKKTLYEIQNRISDLKKVEKPLIAYLKVAEKEKSSPAKTTSN